ncbi:hypothetical protein DT065_14795 [Salicibibacter kimchii]|uniref:Uncharacterized protein n=2 Tax=Salicibibacter kimchii TaxID=2099786 RepID=A0A345C1Q7_9BACI|nr:hypothetical protein DT065_14795 [Salicibibacter kimchii]
MYFAFKNVLQKLIGASFSISIFFIFIFIYTGFNLFQIHELITTPWIWAVFFGYGLISSFIIDFIGKFLSSFTINKQIVLYILFGYLIFLATLSPIYLLIAGTIGAFFSLLFLFGKEKLKVTKWYSWAAFVVPLISIMMIPFDHTSKQGWDEVHGDNFVEVEYEYFNGEHLVPIHGVQGDQIYFEVDHQFRNGNSYGISVYDKNSENVGMNPRDDDDDVLSVHFEEEAVKYIVVRAIHGHDGQFRVNWWKEGEG